MGTLFVASTVAVIVKGARCLKTANLVGNFAKPNRVIFRAAAIPIVVDVAVGFVRHQLDCPEIGGAFRILVVFRDRRYRNDAIARGRNLAVDVGFVATHTVPSIPRALGIIRQRHTSVAVRRPPLHEIVAVQGVVIPAFHANSLRTHVVVACDQNTQFDRTGMHTKWQK